MATNKPIFAIVGPTASGKTEIAVELALRLKNAEIINCDSVQIYKTIQIATAKPTKEEMRGVPHHLLDYVPPEINYTVSDWSKDAAKKIIEIESRGKTAILVGGSGFYLRTLREPFFEGPKPDKKFRERLMELSEKKGVEHLHKIVNRIDPESADKLFSRDYVRNIRAIEVFFQTGQRMSELQPQRIAPPEFAKRIEVFALKPPRDILYEIINKRTETHFKNGLVEEVRLLRENGLRDDTNALGSHGYRRVCEYLRGERTLESAIEKTKQNVRNYAKRQMSWFRKETGVNWIEGFGNEKKTQDSLWEIAGLTD